MKIYQIAMIAALLAGAAAPAAFAQQQGAPPAQARPAPTADDFEILKDQLAIVEQQRNQANSDFAAQRAQMTQLARSYNALVAAGTKKDAKIKELEDKIAEAAKPKAPVEPPKPGAEAMPPAAPALTPAPPLAEHPEPPARP
jgi:septal ring factor EnvC (AmiA/AmiB activator)